MRSFMSFGKLGAGGFGSGGEQRLSLDPQTALRSPVVSCGRQTFSYDFIHTMGLKMLIL